MKVFVVGGSGFLGRRTLALLTSRGHDVYALARSAAAAEAVSAAGARAVHGDLDAVETVARAIRQASPDTALVSVPFTTGHGPRITAILEATGVVRVVFVSTTSIFTRLETDSKPLRLGAEKCIRRSALDWTILRPTMIYGGLDDRNIARLLRFLQRAPLVPLPAQSRLHQPVHVLDVADAVVRALETATAIGKTYELAGPQPISLVDLVDEAAAALGKRVRKVPVPLRPTIALARIYERLARTPRLRSEQFERLGEDKSFDITDARRDLGFDPRPFHVGVRQEGELLSRRVPGANGFV